MTLFLYIYIYGSLRLEKMVLLGIMSDYMLPGTEEYQNLSLAELDVIHSTIWSNGIFGCAGVGTSIFFIAPRNVANHVAQYLGIYMTGAEHNMCGVYIVDSILLGRTMKQVIRTRTGRVESTKM